MVERPGALSARAAWGVAALVREVGDWLAGRFGACTVRGELSGFSRAASGHCYFSLKDADGGTALLRCAMFRRAASLLNFSPGDGQLVEVRGRLGVYEARGELQLVVESMQSAGAGALYEQFLRLKARLESQGLFDPSKKRPLPPHPRTVGIVTSLGAAALHDVLTALSRRVPHVSVIVYPSPVQGAGAPESLVAAIGLASRRAEVDSLIVCRGGGSLEDLWAFNDERVVRAIAASTMPVISGVGHETDLTLADLAADLRAPTPTAAAELVATARAVLLGALDGFASAMQRRIRDRLDAQAQRLDRAALRLARPGQAVRKQGQHLALLAHRLAGHLPRVIDTEASRLGRLEAQLRVASRQGVLLQVQRLGNLDARWRRAALQRVARHAQALDALEARLRALDPARVLARGYAWVSDEGGRPLISVRQLRVGSCLTAVLQDGQADVQVTALRAGEGA